MPSEQQQTVLPPVYDFCGCCDIRAAFFMKVSRTPDAVHCPDAVMQASD
jgi:hypothetical protein